MSDAQVSDKDDKNVLNVADIRMQRPRVYHETSTRTALVLQLSATFDVEGTKLTFPAPNTVSLFLNIYQRDLRGAKKIYDRLIRPKIGTKEIKVKGRNLSRIYNYLENIQGSVIAIYSAVEAFANIAIPSDFRFEKRNGKGVTEIWDKKSIERWFKTSEKLSEVLPETLKIASLKGTKLWNDFLTLESIRNSIIHQKATLGDQQDSAYMSALLQPSIFKFLESGARVIEYFCNADLGHAYFPLGFGNDLVRPIEVDRFEDALTPWG